MNETTTAPSYNKCGYCGNFHSYSPETCRDMMIAQAPVLPWKIEFHEEPTINDFVFCPHCGKRIK